MTFQQKIVDKSSNLKDIIDGSNRLYPLLLSLFDDLKCNIQLKNFLGFLITKYCEKKNVIVLTLDEFIEQFYLNHKISKNSNLKVITEFDFDLNKNYDHFSNLTKHLVQLIDQTKENVLIINSINCMQYLCSNNFDVKSMCQWLYSLREHFPNVIVVYHTDVRMDFHKTINLDEKSYVFNRNQDLFI